MGSFLTERTEIVGVLSPANKGGAAYNTLFVNMSNYQRCTFLVYCGTIAGTNVVMTANSAADNAGTTTTAINCNYRKGTANAANKSYFNAAMASLTTSGLSIDTGNDDNRLYAVEVLASDLTAGQNYVGLEFSNAGNSGFNTSVTAVLSDARHNRAIPLDATV